MKLDISFDLGFLGGRLHAAGRETSWRSFPGKSAPHGHDPPASLPFACADLCSLLGILPGIEDDILTSQFVGAPWQESNKLNNVRQRKEQARTHTHTHTHKHSHKATISESQTAHEHET